MTGCICDPLRGITCAPHAEQARAASQGRPMVDETAARAAGWVPLAEVLEALRDEAEQQLARAHDLPERAYARGVAYSSHFLAEWFRADQPKETT